MKLGDRLSDKACKTTVAAGIDIEVNAAVRADMPITL